jgi:hypothetical protein
VKNLAMNARAGVGSESRRNGRSRKGESNASAVVIRVNRKGSLSIFSVEHTSRFHVRCSEMYELLHLLRHDLSTAPCRLVFWLHRHRWWKEALGLGLSLFFGGCRALAPET